MSKGMNRVVLFGNLGASPELRKTPSGTSVLRLRVATTRTWRNKDGVRDEHTEWHNVSVFGSRADGLHRILRRGSLLLVEGRIHTKSYDRDGVRRYYTEIQAEEVVLGGRRAPRPEESGSDDAEGSASGDLFGDEQDGASFSAPSSPEGGPAADEPAQKDGIETLPGGFEIEGRPETDFEPIEPEPTGAHEPEDSGATGTEDSEEPAASEAPPKAPKPRRGGATEATLPSRKRGRRPAQASVVAAA